MTSDEEKLGHVVSQTRLQRIEELENLLERAWALIAQATHMVDDSYPNWHRNAEQFLVDSRQGQ